MNNQILVKAIMSQDADGFQVDLECNHKKASYRLDTMKQQDGKKQSLLYRVDMKPNTRQHSIVEGDPELWVEKNIDKLKESVM